MQSTDFRFSLSLPQSPYLFTVGLNSKTAAPPPLIRLLPYNKTRNQNFRDSATSTATVTSKGQIIIPAAVRASLGLEAGSRVEFVEISKGHFAIVPATNSVRALKGMLRKPASPVSIEQMHEAIAARGAKAR